MTPNEVFNIIDFKKDLFFLLGGPTSTNLISHSTDGVSWTNTSVPIDSYYHAITYFNGEYIASPYFGQNLVYTSNAFNWSTRQFQFSSGFTDFKVAGGYLIGVGPRGNNDILRSADGINWTEIDIEALNYYPKKIAYGNGLLIAVDDQSQTDKVIISDCAGNCFENWWCPNGLFSRALITGLTSGATWQGNPGTVRFGGLSLMFQPPSPPYFDDDYAEVPVTKSGTFIVDEEVVITNAGPYTYPLYGTYDWNGTFVLAAKVGSRHYLRCVGTDPWNGNIPTGACIVYAQAKQPSIEEGQVYGQVVSDSGQIMTSGRITENEG